jgi:hypothetical protein
MPTWPDAELMIETRPAGMSDADGSETSRATACWLLLSGWAGSRIAA